jgi:hypothetical protein
MAPDRRTLLLAGALANAVFLTALLYELAGLGVGAVRYVVYAALWLVVAPVAVATTPLPRADDSARRRALAVAVGYTAVLFVAGGVVVLGGGMTAGGFRVAMLPPGWGPAPIYDGALVNVVAMPARVAGYAALGYLVYATLLEAADAFAYGVLGLLSCVSCTWPVLAALATAVLGGGSALASATLSASYGLSTAVFLLTVGLLYWRPFVGRG